MKPKTLATGTLTTAEAQAADAPPTLTPPYFYPQPLTPTPFIGREPALAELHKHLTQTKLAQTKLAQTKLVAITGISGIGKTTLAHQYVHQHQASYPGGIWWVSAHELPTQTLEHAAKSIGLETLPAELTTAQTVQHYLTQWNARLPGHKLLVIDDVETYETIQPFLPTQQGAFRVLMTSQTPMPHPVTDLNLEGLNHSAVLHLLRSLVSKPESETDSANDSADKRLQQNETATKALCAWLSHSPLSIELAAKLLVFRPEWSVTKLLNKLKRKTQQHESIGPVARLLNRQNTPPDAVKALEAALALSWEQLHAADRQLAVMLSLFAPAPIPWELVQEVIAQCHVHTQPSGRWPHLRRPNQSSRQPKPKQWCQLLTPKAQTLARQKLISLHLLQRIGKKHYQLHRQVQAFLQTKRQPSKRATEILQSFAQTMTAIAKRTPTLPAPTLPAPTFPTSEQAQVKDAVPHMEAVAANWTAVLKAEDKAWCHRGLAQFYQGLNLPREAERCYQQAVTISKTVLGETHLDTAGSLHHLAELYQSQGRWKEAEPLYVQALNIHKAALGEKHSYIAATLNNLAELYQAQGRYDDAEPLYVQALEIWRAKLGDKNLLTASTLNSLAALYQAQKRYDDAETLYVQALEMSQSELGERHPHTATGLNNLALLYKLQGRYGDAEQLYLQALDIRKTELGENHLDTASSLNNLAALYKAQNRYHKAEPLYVQALDIRKSELGDRHLDTAVSFNNLAALYKAQRRYYEAETLYVQALEIRKVKLGDCNLSTAGNLFNLAELYQSTQQYQKALTAIQQTLNIYMPVLGKHHPSTQAAISWQALIQATLSQKAIT